jgi:hypothetical protein
VRTTNIALYVFNEWNNLPPFAWAYRKEKIRGAETNLPDFSGFCPTFARLLPKKFFGDDLF